MPPRSVPHTGLCAVCYRPIIDARCDGELIRLDAEPKHPGDYSAFLDGLKDVWICRPYDEGPKGPFMGLSRRVHTCPDTQLTL